eukprot:scaffold65748_cov39-Phaeocystis_antarctica.AAC.1
MAVTSPLWRSFAVAFVAALAALAAFTFAAFAAFAAIPLPDDDRRRLRSPPLSAPRLEQGSRWKSAYSYPGAPQLPCS